MFTGIAACCALAVSGHVAAAPPSSVMNWRRFMPKLGLSVCPNLPQSGLASPWRRPESF